jgi:prepilin-type N-terminal cleavage/methylation domain-containing protein
MKNRLNNSRSAFTLIEMMVVIGIIAILTSLIIPSLNLTQQAAQTAECSSTIKQLGLTVMASAMKSKMPNDIIFTGINENDFFDQACGFVLPIEEPPPPPEGEEETSSTNNKPSGSYYNFLLDTKNYGCPLAERNPLFGTEDEPEYRSYGVLRYNLQREVQASHEWLLVDSIYQYVNNSSEVATDRHQGEFVNAFYIDGSVRTLQFSEVSFPE